MKDVSRIAFVCALSLVVACGSAAAQSTTYHLHKEVSSTPGLLLLHHSNPEGSSIAIQSVDLKQQTAAEYVIEEFDTLAGVPNTAGTIAANTTLTFTIWMRKTANWGTLYPRVRVLLNNDAGTLLCETTGTTALTTTLTTYGLTCTTAAEIVTSTSDRVYLWVGINMTQGPGNKSVRAELDIEGTANGNYDSRIAVPNPLLPTITSLIPA